MRLPRPVLPLLALFLLALAPSCKKSAEGEASDAVSSESDEKSEKASETKKGKKAKAKSKKKKAEPSEATDGSGEDKEEGTAKARSKKSKALDKGEEAAGETAKKPAEDGLAKPVAGKPAKDKEEGETAGDSAAAKTPETEDKAAQPLHSLPPNATPPEEAASAPVASQLGIGRLLTNTDLNSQLPMKGWAGHGPVPGIAPSEFYNSIFYKIPNTSAFVAIQVWDFDTPSMSLDKWNEIQQTYPNAEAYAEGFVKDAIYSYRNQVKTFAFYEPKLSMVVALSCYVQACEDSALYQLSELVYARLQTK